jgi:FixJ family two-component response regulator
MPGMSGFELQDRLAARATRIPVILITGHDTPESCERAANGGASAYLRKPVDGDVLLAAVARAVKRGRLPEGSPE